jgi:hypothetical protein
LYTESVFFGWYWLVFLGIYHMKANRKLGRYQNVRGNPLIPQKEDNGPHFTQKGGDGPLFEEPSSPFEGEKLGTIQKGGNDTN